MLWWQQFGEIIDQLINAVAALAFYTVVGLASALKLVECSTSIERLAVQDIDAGQVKRFCGLEGLGRDAPFKSEGLWRSFG